MANEPKANDQTNAKHHYVTRAYLEGILARGETQLWVYQRNSDNVFRNIPKNLASRKAYYTVVNRDGTEDDVFEKLLAQEIEGPGVPVIRKLSTGTKQLNLNEIVAGATLIAMQELRVPFKREQLSIMLKAMGESLMKASMAAPGYIERVLQELKDEGKVDASVSAEEMRVLDLDLIPTVSGNLWVLGQMLGRLIGTYAAMKWTVLISPYQGFVSSDCPVCREYPQTARDPAGVVNPDLTIYFAIAHDRVLMLKHDERKYALFERLMKTGRKREAEQLRARAPSISYTHVTKPEADRINGVIIERAMRWVYAPIEMPHIPDVFRGESRNVRVELESLDESGTIKLTHRIS